MNTKNCLSDNVEKNATGLHWFNGDETIEITTSDTKLITRIRHLANADDRIIIDSNPSENDGYLICLLPTEYIYTMHKKVKKELTEEQRKELSERAKKMRLFRKNSL